MDNRQWPTTQDSCVVDEPGQRSVADLSQDPDPAGLLESVGLGQLFDHDGVDSGDLQLGCQRQPHRSRSDDQDLSVNFHFRADPA
jgi:hypothetical protein